MNQYELLATLSPNCRRARDRRTGAAVLLHTVPAAEADEAAQLLRQWGLLLGQEEQAGQACLITGDTPDLIFLQTWVRRNRPKEPGELSQMFRVPQPADAGEFTRLFRMAGPVAADVPTAPAKPEVHEAKPIEAEPLDGTRTISFSAPGVIPATEPEPVPPPVPLATAKPAAGEFTQMFHLPPPAPGTEGKVPGEFTSLFRPAVSTPAAEAPAPLGVPASKPQPEPEPAPPPNLPAAGQPGEFTSLFRPAVSTPAAEAPTPRVVPGSKPQAEPEPAPPPRLPAAGQPGEFTSLFRPAVSTPAAEAPAPLGVPASKPQPEPEPAPPPNLPAAGQPGEFTSLFRPAVSTPAVEAPAPRVVPASKPQPEPEPAPPPRLPGAGQPSEFTALFRPGTPMPEPERLATASDDRTRLFAVPSTQPETESSFIRQFHPQAPPAKPSMPAPTPESRDFDNFWDAPYESNQAGMDPKLQGPAQSSPPRTVPAVRDEFPNEFEASSVLPDMRSGQSLNPDATRFFNPPPQPSRPDSRHSAPDDDQWEALFRPRTPATSPPAQQAAPAKSEAALPRPPQNKTLLIVSIVLGVLLLIAIVVISVLLMRH